MSVINKLLASFSIALTGTIFDIAHHKIGGLIAGGIYYNSHSWDEIMAMSSSFVGTFFIIFAGSLIWFFIIRRPVKFKCLKCGYEIETTKLDDAYCNNCNLTMKNVKDIK